MTRVLLYVSAAAVLGGVGFAVGARAPAAALKRKRRRVAPLAVAALTGGGTFPAWAIAGFCLTALLVGGGVTGMVVSRGRR